MDSLPNSYSIYFPSGVPSVSFPLPFLKFLCTVFHSHSAFLFPSCPHALFFISRPPFFLSLATIYPPLQSHVLFFSPTLQFYFLSLFLTSSSVVWLTEKCLICKVFLLDSSWLKMSATPPGAVGTWYSTMVECWSCVFRYHAVVSGLILSLHLRFQSNHRTVK